FVGKCARHLRDHFGKPDFECSFRGAVLLKSTLRGADDRKAAGGGGSADNVARWIAVASRLRGRPLLLSFSRFSAS
ncbi:MAG: hypothetical protein LBQ54_07285, partial [Planctomycetaceae bacterium]|nr:hypothetical protein [Planctomycetaceae bacterium]